jgi:predicted ester cyclase
MHESFSDFYQEDDEILVSGNRIISINTTTLTQTGTFGYLPPSGKDLVVPGVTIYEVESGMVTKMMTIFDRLAPYQEMGFKLVMPEEG